VTSSIPSGRGPAAVHPHLPRFSQGVTGVLCLEAAVFGDRWAVAVAAALVAVALLAPRWSPVGWIFRQVARPAEDLEPAAPVRFAQWMALTLLCLAFALLVAGADTAGWAIVGLVSAVALFSAITGFCVGCRIYRILLLRRRASADSRRDLGLAGAGPWLVVLTAPGCARCEPVARSLEAIAAPRQVTRVSLAERPGAGRMPVSSVPAVLVVDPGGRLVAARAGRLDEPMLRELVAVAAA
jgi:Domain of unknown function (DUF4395)